MCWHACQKQPLYGMAAAASYALDPACHGAMRPLQWERAMQAFAGAMHASSLTSCGRDTQHASLACS